VLPPQLPQLLAAPAIDLAGALGGASWHSSKGCTNHCRAPGTGSLPALQLPLVSPSSMHHYSKTQQTPSESCAGCCCCCWCCCTVQLALGVTLTSRLGETLLLFKAVAVAVGAPDAVLPPPDAPGSVGLLAMYVSIIASFLGSFLAGMLAHWLVEARGTAPPAAASKGDGADEEQGVTRPLLGRASWEAPAAAGRGKLAAGAAAGSGGAADGKEADAAGGKVRGWWLQQQEQRQWLCARR
jgi:hypothetical protein